MQALTPYSGFRSFEAYESVLFFAREQETEALYTQLKARHIVTVIGTTACGKSSLVKAGLIPRLMNEQSRRYAHKKVWLKATFRPNAHPFTALLKALSHLREENRGNTDALHIFDKEDIKQLTHLLEGGVKDTDHHSAIMSTWLFEKMQPLQHLNVLLYIDQFDEIFRYPQSSHQQITHFFSFLIEALQHPNIYIVMTMHSSFLEEISQYQSLAKIIHHSLYVVPSLDTEQLKEAIVSPARFYDLHIEEDLLGQLIDTINDSPTDLALLQLSLLRLWRKTQGDKKPQTLTLSLFKKEQGLLGIINDEAEEAWSELNEKQQSIAKTVFISLSQIEDEHSFSRYPTPVRTLLALAETALEELQTVVDVFRRAGRCFLTPTIGGVLALDTVLDIEYEGFIRAWQRLQTWLDQEYKHIQHYQQLEAAAKRYEAKQGDLLQALELDNLLTWFNSYKPKRQWAERYGTGLAFDLAVDFLLLSKDRDNKEKAYIQALEEHEFDAHIAHATLLVRMNNFVQARKQLAITRQLEQRMKIPQTRCQMRNRLAAFVDFMSPKAEYVYDSVDTPFNGNLAINRDGSCLAVSGERGSLVLFERKTGKLLQHLHAEQFTAMVWDIVFHPKQDGLFSVRNDGLIVYWQLMDSGQSIEAAEHWHIEGTLPTALAISANGKVLASGHTDGKIRLWNVDEESFQPFIVKKSSTPLLVGELTGHTQGIAQKGLDFSPNGKYLASTALDYTVRVWDYLQADEVFCFSEHKGFAFSPDSRFLATFSQDSEISLWDLQTGKCVQKLVKNYREPLFKLQYCAQDKLLSSSLDGIDVWDIESENVLRAFQGHAAGVLALRQWQDDEQLQLYSASNDGTVKRWLLLEDTRLPGLAWLDLPEKPFSTAISPQGDRVAVGFFSGGLRVYKLADQSLLNDMKAVHKKAILRLAFNADGSLLASAGMDGLVQTWSVKDDALLLNSQFRGHSAPVHAVTFSPDGTELATASYDGKIGLFKLHSKERILFRAHPAGDHGGVETVGFLANGKGLFSCGYYDKKLKFWNLEAEYPRLEKKLATFTNIPLWMSVSPDNQWLAVVGREGNVTLYPISDNKAEPMRLLGHEQTVYKAIFSPDSQQLVTLSWDLTVRFWDLAKQEELFCLPLSVNPALDTPFWDFDVYWGTDDNDFDCWIAIPTAAAQLVLYQLQDAKS